MPRHERVDRAPNERAQRRAEQPHEAKQPNPEPAKRIASQQGVDMSGRRTHVEKLYGGPPRRKVSVTQKFAKHALDASMTMHACTSLGSVTASRAVDANTPKYPTPASFRGQSGSAAHNARSTAACAPAAR